MKEIDWFLVKSRVLKIYYSFFDLFYVFKNERKEINNKKGKEKN